MSSNNLTQVRDYIKTRLLVVKPDYTEWLGSLSDIGNIPATIVDYIYHITLNPTVTSAQNDVFIVDQSSVIVTVFKRGFEEPVVARDELMEIGNCIRLDVVNPLNVEAYKLANDGNIENVIGGSLAPSEINDTNDNIIKVEINLELNLYLAAT